MKKFKAGNRVKSKLDGIKGKVLFCNDDVALIHFDGFTAPFYVHKKKASMEYPKKFTELPTRKEFYDWWMSGDKTFCDICDYLGIQ